MRDLPGKSAVRGRNEPAFREQVGKSTAARSCVDPSLRLIDPCSRFAGARLDRFRVRNRATSRQIRIEHHRDVAHEQAATITDDDAGFQLIE